jgi:hypothetical protein
MALALNGRCHGCCIIAIVSKGRHCVSRAPPACNSQGTALEFSLNFLCVNEIVLISREADRVSAMRIIGAQTRGEGWLNTSFACRIRAAYGVSRRAAGI